MPLSLQRGTEQTGYPVRFSFDFRCIKTGHSANQTLQYRMSAPKFGIFVVSDLEGPAWRKTHFYTVPRNARAVDVIIPPLCISKIVVFRFCNPGGAGSALSQVICRYIQPHNIKSPFINKYKSCTPIFFKTHSSKIRVNFFSPSGDPIDVVDITNNVTRELQRDDVKASQHLHNLLNTLITEDDKANPSLGPLVHWMRCFSLEQPDGASPVIPGSGFPMALSLDPELVAEALPRAFKVACGIAPKLKTARAKPEIALCFGLILRAFAGQYAVERKDDRSLIKGMFTLHDPGTATTCR